MITLTRWNRELGKRGEAWAPPLAPALRGLQFGCQEIPEPSLRSEEETRARTHARSGPHSHALHEHTPPDLGSLCPRTATADWHLGSDASAIRLAPARGSCRTIARCCRHQEAGLQVSASRVSRPPTPPALGTPRQLEDPGRRSPPLGVGGRRGPAPGRREVRAGAGWAPGFSLAGGRGRGGGKGTRRGDQARRGGSGAVLSLPAPFLPTQRATRARVAVGFHSVPQPTQSRLVTILDS